MSKKESLTSIRALRKDAIHLRLANANLSCKGSKDAMARRLHRHLSAQSTPTSTGQRRSRSANQRTPLPPKTSASTVANRHQGRAATTTSQQPPSTRRTERQLANDDEAVDSSGDDSDDHRRRPPPTNSNGHQRPSRTRRRLTRSRSPHQRRHGTTRSLRQRGLSVSSDTESGEHRPRHRRESSSSRSSSLSSSTSLSSVQSSARSSASSSPSWNHRHPSRRCSHRHLRGQHRRHHHNRRHHHHRRHGHSQRESHSPTPFVSCAPPPHNRIISKIRRGKYIDFDYLLPAVDDIVPVQAAQPPVAKRGHQKSIPPRKVTDFQTWMEAWNSFLIIATHHTPSRSLELIQYQALVSHLFQAYPIHVAIRYDQLFRQAAARDPVLRWDTFKEDLLVWCSTRRSFRAPISSRLGPPTYRPNSGQATTTTINISGPSRRTHTEGGAEICKRYNLGNCTRGEECKFTHACWNAGCRALHSAKACPLRAATGE